MTRRFTILLLAFAVVYGAAALHAHDDFRIIGTIAKGTPKTLEVKQTNDGTVISMKATSALLVTRNKKKVPSSELKAGLSVVVDARGDSLKDLEVVEVKIVQLAAPKK